MTSQNLLLSDVWWRQACPVRSDALTNALTPDQRCLPHSAVAGRLSICVDGMGSSEKTGIFLPPFVILNHISTSSQSALYVTTVQSFVEAYVMTMLPIETMGSTETFFTVWCGMSEKDISLIHLRSSRNL